MATTSIRIWDEQTAWSPPDSLRAVSLSDELACLGLEEIHPDDAAEHKREFEQSYYKEFFVSRHPLLTRAIRVMSWCGVFVCGAATGVLAGWWLAGSLGIVSWSPSLVYTIITLLGVVACNVLYVELGIAQAHVFTGWRIHDYEDYSKIQVPEQVQLLANRIQAANVLGAHLEVEQLSFDPLLRWRRDDEVVYVAMW